MRRAGAVVLVVGIALGAGGCARGFTAFQPPPSDAGVSLLQATVLQTAVAPRGHTAIIASGGQPPYTFAFTQQGSGAGATVYQDGGYLAGDAGSTIDVLQVGDAADQHALVAITVGPWLQVFPEHGTALPGQPLTFVATGGQPPYAFAFASAGNTSWGSMDPSGQDIAGPNQDETDTIEVVDSNGVPLNASVDVGTPRLDTDLPDVELIPGDFNGDGVADLLLADSSGVLKLAIGGVGGPILTQTLRYHSVPEHLVGDFDGDGCDDVLVLSGATSIVYQGQRGGELTPGPTFQLGAGFQGGFLNAPVLASLDLRPALPKVYLAAVIASTGTTGTFAVFEENLGGAMTTSPLGETPFHEVYSVDFPTAFPLFIANIASHFGAVMVEGSVTSPPLYIPGFHLVGVALHPDAVVESGGSFSTSGLTSADLYDLNQDGVPDLGEILTNPNGTASDFQYQLGFTDGGFGAIQTTANGIQYVFRAPPDLGHAHERLLGIANGSAFELVPSASGDVAQVPSQLPPTPTSYLAGDFNGDGQDDFIERQTTGDLFFLATDALGNLPTGRVFQISAPVTNVVQTLAIGDLHGDGRADVAVDANESTTILKGTPQGRLALELSLQPGSQLLTSLYAGGVMYFCEQAPNGVISVSALFALDGGGWDSDAGQAIADAPDSTVALSAGGVPGGDILAGLNEGQPPYWALLVNQGGGDFNVQALLQFGAGALLPIEVSGSTNDDLVYQSGLAAPIQVFSTTSSQPAAWALTPSATIDAAKVGAATSALLLVGTYASVPGGRPDRILVGDSDAGAIYAYDPASSSGSLALSGATLSNSEFGYAVSLGIGDVNGDGLNDLLWLNPSASNGSPQFDLALAVGSGFQAQALSFSLAPDSALTFGVGDIDGDGRADLVLENGQQNTLSVYLATGLPDGGVNFR
jgi:hypothetical protein